MRSLKAVDLFCGAGGMTLGAELSGRVDVVLAVNHWKTAIQTHQQNHPRTRHICARIEDMDLRSEHDLPDVDVIMGGIECTHHSVARGAAPINDQRRTSAWRVIDWIGKFRPVWCVFENVREFLGWGPIDKAGRKIKSKAGEIFEAWVNAIRAHGYHVEWKLLNAAHFGEATRRVRLFIVVRRGGSTTPFRWPSPTHGSADRITRCLKEEHRCNLLLERPAHEIIDWSRPCPSIFARSRPLAEKTLRRIEIGLRKFVEPFLVHLKGSSTVDSTGRPLGTVCAQASHWGLACPFFVPRHGERNGQSPRTHGPGRPLPTLTCSNNPSLVVPFIVQYHNGPDGERRTYPFTAPLPTLDTQPRYAMAMPMIFAQGSYCNGRSAEKPMPTLLTTARPWIALPFVLPRLGFFANNLPRDVREPLHTIVAGRDSGHVVMPFMCRVNHGDGPRTGDRVNGCDEPLRTITTHRGESVIYPFLTKYYGTGGARPVSSPLDTVTAKHRHGLTLVHTMRELGIIDIGFRMLDVDELAAAQGFPADYVLHGNKADQIRQVGNAVCPKVMRAICEQLD